MLIIWRTFCGCIVTVSLLIRHYGGLTELCYICRWLEWWIVIDENRGLDTDCVDRVALWSSHLLLIFLSRSLIFVTSEGIDRRVFSLNKVKKSVGVICQALWFFCYVAFWLINAMTIPCCSWLESLVDDENGYVLALLYSLLPCSHILDNKLKIWNVIYKPMPV